MKLKQTKISYWLRSRSNPNCEENFSYTEAITQSRSSSSSSVSLGEVTFAPPRRGPTRLKKLSNIKGSYGEESPIIVLHLDGILTCDVATCNYQTSFKIDLARHKKNQHELKLLKCPNCDYATHSENAFTRHTSIHDGNLPFKCQLCPWTYPVLSLLTQHMKQIHERAERRKQGISRASEFGKRFKCSKCDFRAVCKQEIHLHNYSHETESKYECSFSGCDYRCKTACSLRKHQKRHDVKAKKEFQCPLFWTKAALSSHITSHKKEQAFSCSKCKFVTSSASRLTTHVRKYGEKSDKATDKHNAGKSLGVENNELSLQTSGTAKSRPNGSANIMLNKDVKSRLKADAHDSPKALKNQRKKPTKMPERKYKCDHCDFIAINKSKITRHAVVHRDPDDKLFSCSFPGCDFKTNWEDYVKKHNRDFHKPIPDLMCPFEGCGFATKWKDFLVKHQKIHAKKRKRVHQCPMCLKAFYDICKLKRHINIHTGENKYNCSLCNYVSGESSNFHAHRRKYHPGQECEPIRSVSSGHQERDLQTNNVGPSNQQT